MSQPAAIILVHSETAVDGDGSKPQQRNLIYVPQLQQIGTEVDGVDSQPQLPNFTYVPQLQQTGTAVNFHDGQHQQPINVIHVQNQQLHQTNLTYVQPQQQTVQDLGRFGQYVNKRITKISGDWLIACGFFAIVGAVSEVVGMAFQIEWLYISDYSLTSYSGFWCGALILASGSVATHSSKHISNCMVITDVVAAVNAIVFATVLLALTAQQLIDVNNACGSPYGCGVDYAHALILSGLSVMIAFSSLALIFGPLLAIFTVIALVKGLRSSN